MLFRSHLFAAPEAFLTSTSVGVLAVASVDGQALGVPAPGPTSRALSERFDAVTEGRDPAFHHWLAFVEEA